MRFRGVKFIFVIDFLMDFLVSMWFIPKLKTILVITFMCNTDLIW